MKFRPKEPLPLESLQRYFLVFWGLQRLFHSQDILQVLEFFQQSLVLFVLGQDGFRTKLLPKSEK
jgi:hypothetical protein